jgi:hypothetical protein
MPKIEPNEDETSYVSRCIPIVMKEKGIPGDEAAAHCHGMYKQHKEKGTQYIEKQMEFNFTFQLQILDNNQVLDTETKSNKMKETDEWVTLRATAVVGNRMMNGYFMSYSELKKSLDQWNGTLHDISHLGTSYPDNTPPFKRENIDYIIGYQSNAEANDKTKAITMDVNVYKKSEKYKSWRSFIDICEKANKTPNVSVSLNATPKAISVSKLEQTDREDYGFKGDETVISLCDIIPKALTTCIKGACDDKKGCGLANNNSVIEQTCENCKNCNCGNDKTSVGVADEKMSEADTKKLAELKQRIKQLKEEK